MSGLLIIMVLSIVLVGGCVSFLPSFSPRGTLFGVTIGQDFRYGNEARRAIGAFRRINVATTIILAITLLGVASIAGRWIFMLPSAFVLAQFAIATVAFARGHKKMLKFAIQVPSTRTASLAPRNRAWPGGPVLFAGPFLLVTFAFLAIWTHRSTLPAETLKAALGSLLVAAFAATLFLLVAALGMFKTRNGEPAVTSGHGSTRRITYFAFLFVAYVMTGMEISMALSAADLISRTAANRAIVASLLLWMVGTLALIVITSRFRSRSIANGPISGDGTSDECWKWGMVYYNPDDPAFLVEKRAGFGWTLNYGNKWAWVFSAAILGAPFLFRFLWFRG